MGFRAFESNQEHAQAARLMAAVDRGERWIFDGAPGSADFGGQVIKQYFIRGDTWGVFHACLFRGHLRLQIGFSPDLPAGEEDGLIGLIRQARCQAPGPASLWYPPENSRLDRLIRHDLPWPVHGHKTHELAFDTRPALPPVLTPDLAFVSYDSTWLEAVCRLLDQALSHTFADPEDALFSRDKEKHDAEWLDLAQAGACRLLVGKGVLAGFVARKGAEIDLMAVAPDRQGRGLGRILLQQARADILREQAGEPHLYCLDSNTGALRFYLREGMRVTGHSGYAWLDALPET
ncbi:MAG: GNAT family N-acetyltransferase [Eubacteriales bacterium]|nr:GNAT family N-acetyltransferase [Clostridiales bacterium]MDD4139504.1 GNAT family N-acetyltransferase [Eubacteriales bacterium]